MGNVAWLCLGAVALLTLIVGVWFVGLLYYRGSRDAAQRGFDSRVDTEILGSEYGA